MDGVLISLEEIAEKYADQINEINKRDFNIECAFEINKAESNLVKGEFTGVAAAFGNEDFGGDVIAQGAFTKQLLEFAQTDSMPGMFFNHKTLDLQVGEWIDLKQTNAGLIGKGILWVEDNPLGRKPSQEAEMIRNSFLSKGPKGLSIGGSIDRTDPDSVQFKEVGPKSAKRIIRILKELRLREISPVSFPMNDKARIKMVKSEDITIRQVEKALMELGYSLQDSKIILSKGFNELKIQRDVGSTADERDAVKALDEGMIAGKLDTLLKLIG